MNLKHFNKSYKADARLQTCDNDGFICAEETDDRSGVLITVGGNNSYDLETTVVVTRAVWRELSALVNRLEVKG